MAIRRAVSSYDESDAKIRPNRRGSRPRSKDRPSHQDAIPARVIAIDRGRYTTLVDDGAPTERTVVAMKARELSRKGIVVGDIVDLVGDVRGGPDSLARAVRIHDRSSVLRRTADDTDPVERVIVANADQLVIVTALANPEPRPRMIDRCLVAAYDAGLEPLLLLTKADLASPDELLAGYAALDLPVLVTRADPATEEFADLSDVREALDGHVSVLVGHSGVGKSTLVNAVVPDADRATGSVNDVTGRGRHTSTSAIALRLPDETGWVIDTPGVRSFGLAHIQPGRIIEHFPDLAAGTADCPRSCSHDEPDCGLDEFVDAGGAGASGRARLDSLRRLLRARTEDPRADVRDASPPAP